MADETSGTPGTDDRDAQATATTGTPPTEDVDAGSRKETAEQRIARLENEKAQWLAEKSNSEKRTKELEEIKRQLAEQEARNRASTPPTAQIASPIEQEIAELADQARQYPNDATVRRALKNALQERQEMQRQAIIQAAEPEFQAMPDAYRERARNAWLQGRAARPVDALMLVKGEAAGDDPEAERRIQEADRAARDRLANTPATTAGASVHNREQTRKLAFSAYLEKVAAGDAKLAADADAGRVEIDYDR